jgi:hypothetical protein
MFEFPESWSQNLSNGTNVTNLFTAFKDSPCSSTLHKLSAVFGVVLQTSASHSQSKLWF